MKNNHVVLRVFALTIVAGSAGFWGGTIYAKTRLGGNFQNRASGRQMIQGKDMGKSVTENRTQANGQLQMRNGATTGEVTAKDDKSITIKMTDGSSRMIILAESTTYHISDTTSLNKIDVGTNVAVFGQSGSDGSITAASIEINPVMIDKAN